MLFCIQVFYQRVISAAPSGCCCLYPLCPTLCVSPRLKSVTQGQVSEQIQCAKKLEQMADLCVCGCFVSWGLNVENNWTSHWDFIREKWGCLRHLQGFCIQRRLWSWIYLACNILMSHRPSCCRQTVCVSQLFSELELLFGVVLWTQGSPNWFGCVKMCVFFFSSLYFIVHWNRSFYLDVGSAQTFLSVLLLWLYKPFS